MQSDIVKIMKHSEALSKNKHPKNKIYETLVTFHIKKCVAFRMQFFKDLARKLKQFVVEFQKNWSIVPFLSDSLEQLLRTLMKIISSKKCHKKVQLHRTQVDAGKSGNQLAVGQTKFGDSVEAYILSSLS